MEATHTQALVHGHIEYAKALTLKIARKLPYYMEFDELMSSAMLGLTEAANAFDPAEGVPFATFSYYRIRGAVFDGIRRMGSLPAALRRHVRREAAEAMAHQSNASVSTDDLNDAAERLDHSMRRASATFLLSQLAEDRQFVSPHSDVPGECAQQELIEQLPSAISALSEKHQFLIRAIYFHDRTMTEIASQLGINKSTICRHHAKALDALLRHLTERCVERKLTSSQRLKPRPAPALRKMAMAAQCG
jgi:RNA polymerase sigma factor for flagellar operon FliA